MNELIPTPFIPGPELLAGRIIFITGAGSGLGKALAIACAKSGATVILSGRNQARLDRVYDEIVALGAPQPAIALLDLAAATAVDYDRLAATIDAEFGRLDGLVHAAAAVEELLERALGDIPHSLVDVSHRQVALQLRGPHAATILNGACPLDLGLAAFPVGMCARTVFAKADIVLWRTEPETFHVEVWRSFADYAVSFLSEAAKRAPPM